jgi:hypothetical protein
MVTCAVSTPELSFVSPKPELRGAAAVAQAPKGYAPPKPQLSALATQLKFRLRRRASLGLSHGLSVRQSLALLRFHGNEP